MQHEAMTIWGCCAHVSAGGGFDAIGTCLAPSFRRSSIALWFGAHDPASPDVFAWLFLAPRPSSARQFNRRR
jgi:hypothetical protein